MSEIEIAAERRRLSLAVCQKVPDVESKNSRNETTNTTQFGENSNRGLLQKLARVSVVSCGTEDGKPPKQGRRLSYCSNTDKQKKDKSSFEDKDTENEGDEKVTENTCRDLGFAIKCKKGLKPESPNQDSFSMTYVGDGKDGFTLYGVYDGHGPVGHDVSQFVKEMLPKLFLEHKERISNPELALKTAYMKCQELVNLQQEEKKMDATLSGCTVTVVYRPHHDNFIVVSHVGDSRSVLVPKSSENRAEIQELTIDHKPNLPKERERIESRGGRVVFDGFYNYRVFAKGAMYPGLNMSRALGDILAHDVAGISGVPDVERIEIKKGKDGEKPILLICTDGVWEFIESPEAAKIVLECMKKNPKDGIMEAANALSREAWDRWLTDSDGEISDDITAFVIDLNVSQVC